jgi:ethanolamine utilization protein EutN
MLLARVIGNVVATVKDDGLSGRTLLVIQPLAKPGTPPPAALVAIDAVGAGVGELVYYCRGKEASFAFLPQQVPSDASIVGIADPASNPDFSSSGDTPAAAARASTKLARRADPEAER